MNLIDTVNLKWIAYSSSQKNKDVAYLNSLADTHVNNVIYDKYGSRYVEEYSIYFSTTVSTALTQLGYTEETLAIAVGVESE